MSLHRVGLMAITTLFTAGMTSMAFAGCCGWDVPVRPVVYSAYAGGCGGCGATYAAPIVYSAYSSGCGGCGTAAYAAPVAYTSPVGYASGCGGCGSAVVYSQPTPIAPAPIYVVNQGPHYAGPGIMVPYKTYSPAAYAAPAYNYPYVAGYAGEGRYAPHPHYYHHRVWHRPHVVYRDRIIYRERHMPMPHMMPMHHHPIGSRG
jgi:hypothetical protein